LEGIKSTGGTRYLKPSGLSKTLKDKVTQLALPWRREFRLLRALTGANLPKRAFNLASFFQDNGKNDYMSSVLHLPKSSLLANGCKNLLFTI